MKIAALSACVIGLALSVHAQNAPKSTQAPPVRMDTTQPTATMTYRTLETGVVPDQQDGSTTVRSRVVARNVQIEMGENILVADEAEIRYRANGDLDDVELRGNVHLKAKLKVK